jgi:hypothetical protein
MNRRDLEMFNGKIVVVWERGGHFQMGRVYLRSADVLIEQAWSLHPLHETIEYDSVVDIVECVDTGAIPQDPMGHISPQAAWEIFEHIIREGLRDERCQLRWGNRDDEVEIENASGYRADLRFFRPLDPDKLNSNVGWEGEAGWTRLSGMTKLQAAAAVLGRDAGDLPSIRTSDRLLVPNFVSGTDPDEFAAYRNPAINDLLKLLHVGLVIGQRLLDREQHQPLREIVRAVERARADDAARTEIAEQLTLLSPLFGDLERAIAAYCGALSVAANSCATILHVSERVQPEIAAHLLSQDDFDGGKNL